MEVFIVEGVAGVYHYHLSYTGESGKPALCGNKDVMHTVIPILNWNSPPSHIPSSYCSECNEIYEKTKQAQAIFFNTSWIDVKGKHPNPFTVITMDDIKEGVYKPLVDQKTAENYIEKLKELHLDFVVYPGGVQ